MSVKVLANHRISPEIIDLIDDAREHVVLITPYVQPWGHLEKSVMAACRRNVKVSLYFRSELEKEYQKHITAFRKYGVSVYAVDSLHAKLYLSESMGIVSSMNLYQYSTDNSEEIALVSNDEQVIRELRKFVGKLHARARSTEKTATAPKTPAPKQSAPKKAVEKVPEKKPAGAFQKLVGSISQVLSGSEELAFCIRCKAELDYDPDRPLCPKCYKSWSQYGDPDYQEKYCHSCGRKGKTSLARPECLACFRENTQ
ncbi:hypothetical protein KDL29_14305 [bacterium]|nr:hypothetical protein [bacterium]